MSSEGHAGVMMMENASDGRVRTFFFIIMRMMITTTVSITMTTTKYITARRTRMTAAAGGLTLREDGCGVSCRLLRVRGIEERYDATKHPVIYRQKVTLGGR